MGHWHHSPTHTGAAESQRDQVTSSQELQYRLGLPSTEPQALRCHHPSHVVEQGNRCVCACAHWHMHILTHTHIYTLTYTRIHTHANSYTHVGKGVWLCLCELLWVTTSHCGLRTYLMSVFNSKFLLWSVYVLFFWLSPTGILIWPQISSQKMAIYIQ